MPIYSSDDDGDDSAGNPSVAAPEVPQATMPHKLRHLHVPKRSRVRFQGVHAPVRLHLQAVSEDAQRGQHLAARGATFWTTDFVHLWAFAPRNQRRRRRLRPGLQRDRDFSRLVGCGPSFTRSPCRPDLNVFCHGDVKH